MKSGYCACANTFQTQPTFLSDDSEEKLIKWQPLILVQPKFKEAKKHKIEDCYNSG
jgi:hypothetical protein